MVVEPWLYVNVKNLEMRMMMMMLMMSAFDVNPITPKA
jgi:hypothetical protein